MSINKFEIVAVLLYLSIFIIATANAAVRNVDLVVKYKTVNFAGKTMQAIAVNDQIPAPTLRFREGDQIKLNVYNHLDQATSLH